MKHAWPLKHQLMVLSVKVITVTASINLIRFGKNN